MKLISPKSLVQVLIIPLDTKRDIFFKNCAVLYFSGSIADAPFSIMFEESLNSNR